MPLLDSDTLISLYATLLLFLLLEKRSRSARTKEEFKQTKHSKGAFEIKKRLEIFLSLEYVFRSNTSSIKMLHSFERFFYTLAINLFFVQTLLPSASLI